MECLFVKLKYSPIIVDNLEKYGAFFKSVLG